MSHPRIIIKKYDSYLSDSDEEKTSRLVDQINTFRDSIESNRTKTMFFETYVAYYIASMFTTAFIVAFYVVQVFTEHYPCLTQTSKNITIDYELAFQLGLIVNLIDGVNTSCVNMHFRFRVHHDWKYLR